MKWKRKKGSIFTLTCRGWIWGRSKTKGRRTSWCRGLGGSLVADSVTLRWIEASGGTAGSQRSRGVSTSAWILPIAAWILRKYRRAARRWSTLRWRLATRLLGGGRLDSLLRAEEGLNYCGWWGGTLGFDRGEGPHGSRRLREVPPLMGEEATRPNRHEGQATAAAATASAPYATTSSSTYSSA